jgi:hypothetical protein
MRGSKGDEQPRMGGNRLRDALAAAQAGRQQLEAVGPIRRRAGRADRRPSVAAGLEEGGVWLPVGVIDGAHLTGLRVGVLDGAAQPHRVGAVAGLGDLLYPAVIARTGPRDGLSDHPREDLAHTHWLGHVGLPCVWPATDVGMVAVEDRRRGEQV